VPRQLDLPYWSSGIEAASAGRGVALFEETREACFSCEELGAVFDANLNRVQNVRRPRPGLRLSVAPGLPGQLFVAYQRRVPEAPFNDVLRVFARTFSFVQPPPAKRGRAVRH
jgi:hypothetical protein